MLKKIQRCGWCAGSELYEAYHDLEWGVPVHDDALLFELLTLEGAQAGLSWITILKKRNGYRDAFDGFNAEKIANYSSIKIRKLMANPRIIRNRLKIESVILNARAFLEVREREGNFSKYVWQFTDYQTQQNNFMATNQVPTTSALSDKMSRKMKKDGFKFIGSTTCYAYMQAIGMVNDHLVSCFRHEECKRFFS